MWAHDGALGHSGSGHAGPWVGNPRWVGVSFTFLGEAPLAKVREKPFTDVSSAPFAAVERHRQEELCGSTAPQPYELSSGWTTHHPSQTGPSHDGLPRPPEAAQTRDERWTIKQGGQGTRLRKLQKKAPAPVW